MLQESFASKARRIALDRIETCGRRIVVSTDFEGVAAELRDSEKSRVSAEFNPSQSRLSPDDCAYLLVRDEGGEIEGFCAVKAVEIGREERLAGYLWRQYRDLYTNGQDPFDPEDLPPLAFDVCGKVSYIGDFYLMNSARGKRKIDDTAFAMLAYAISTSEWQADWTFCLTKHRSATRGLAARYACTQTYPCAISWRHDVDKRRNDDWMMFLSARDRDWVLRKYAARNGEFSSH